MKLNILEIVKVITSMFLTKIMELNCKLRKETLVKYYYQKH